MAARTLDLILGEDNQIWALDPASGIGYRMPPSDQRNQHPPVAGASGNGAPAGIPDAPADGNLYGRENAAWAVVPAPGVAKTGDTMTGTLVMNQAEIELLAPGASPTPVIYVRNDVTYGGFVVAKSAAQGSPGVIQLSPGGPPSITLIGSGGNSAWNPTQLIFGASNAQTTLQMDTTTGDLIAVANSGPNAGKSVNLTLGHWA